METLAYCKQSLLRKINRHEQYNLNRFDHSDRVDYGHKS